VLLAPSNIVTSVSEWKAHQVREQSVTDMFVFVDVSPRNCVSNLLLVKIKDADVVSVWLLSSLLTAVSRRMFLEGYEEARRFLVVKKSI
jgi:hypothetical protein